MIDTSVLVAAVDRGQSQHVAALEWLSRAVAAGEPLSTPWIAAAELGAAIARSTGDEGLAQAAVDHLTGGVIELAPVGPSLGRRSAAIALERRIRGCDAVFVALAAERGEALVTLDAEQAARAGAVATVVAPR